MAKFDPNLVPLDSTVTPDRPCQACGATEGCQYHSVSGDLGCQTHYKAMKGFKFAGKTSNGLYTHTRTADRPVPDKKQPLEEAKPQQEVISRTTRSKKGRVFSALQEMYGNDLRYNEMTKKIELISTGQELEADFIYIEILQEGLDVGSKEFAIDVFNYLAKPHSYNPVRDYLEQVYAKHSDSGIALLENAADRYLKQSDWLYRAFLRKTLISAVARALSPGCKVDTALILQGGQGLYKSTFWSILAGDWFCDSLGSFSSDTDEKIKLYSAWIHEWGELETVFKRKDNSQIKAFLTAQTDTFRSPWGRTAEKYRRHSIVVGTTNTDDFLSDSTGDRRYWVIPIKKQICIELLERERDILWAAAVAAYKSGASWDLSPEEKRESGKRNRQYRREEPWQDAIEDYLSTRTAVRVSDLLTHAIGLELPRQDRSAQMRVADVLRGLGWQKEHTEKGKIWRLGSQGSQDESEALQGELSNPDYLFSGGSQEVVSSQENGAKSANPDYLPDHPDHQEVIRHQSVSESQTQQSLTTLTHPNPKVPVDPQKVSRSKSESGLKRNPADSKLSQAQSESNSYARLPTLNELLVTGEFDREKQRFEYIGSKFNRVCDGKALKVGAVGKPERSNGPWPVDVSAEGWRVSQTVLSIELRLIA